MSSTLRGAALAAVCFAAAARAALAAPAVRLPEDYTRALRLLERGRDADAKVALEAAVLRAPRSDEAARTYGSRVVGYFPYLQLSVVAYRQHDLDEARRQLARELAEGAAQRAAEARTLLARQSLLLDNLEYLLASTRSEKTARTRVQLEREELLSAEVATRCGERPGASAPEGRPWYHHWLLARELEDHGDWLGALQHVSRAIDLRDQPGRFQRTYGMGFVDYRPFLELGRLHHHLGNHACAADALALSERVEVLGAKEDDVARERSELLSGARARVATGK